MEDQFTMKVVLESGIKSVVVTTSRHNTRRNFERLDNFKSSRLRSFASSIESK